MLFHFAGTIQGRQGAALRRSGSPTNAPPLYMHADAEDKYERNQGARFKVEPVTDEAVIAQLHEETPEIPQGATFVHIVEVLPLG